MSTYFRELWELSAFRRSFRALQSLGDERLSLLAQAIDIAELDPMNFPADASPDEADQFREALIVLRSLRGIKDTAGLSALLDDIEFVVGEKESRQARRFIAELFVETPQEVIERRIDIVQRSGLPVLTRLSISVDLRVAPPEGEDIGVALVPIMIVRLEFDEPIGGQEAIVFQVSGDELDDFSAIISRATSLRDEVAQRMPADLMLRSNLEKRT